MNYFNKALKTLGLNTLKSKKQLKKAYFSKSKELHPDAGGDKLDFITLTNSYKYLEKKVPENYQINFKVEDIVNKTSFSVNNSIKVHATYSNLKDKKININVNGKPIYLIFNYVDNKQYPLTFENNKCYINVDTPVLEEEFIQGITHQYFAERFYTLYIPNSGYLRNDVKIGKDLILRFNFVVKRLCQKDGKKFELKSEELSQWLIKHNKIS